MSVTVANPPAKPSTLVTNGSIDGSSFVLGKLPVRTRLIWSIEGPPKSGKTHLSLTWPGAIAYHNFDDGLNSVKEKFDSEKQIHVAGYNVPVPFTQKSAQPLWTQFITDYKVAMTSPEVATDTVDTGSEAWELLRMARLGGLTAILPVKYTEANAEFSSLLRLARQSKKHLVLIHRQKDEYLNDARTGNKIRAGFRDVEFEADVILQTFKRNVLKAGQSKYGFKLVSCRQNPDLEGQEFEGERCNFPALAKAIFPESSEGDWL